jgi:hypothetical protein
MRWLSRLSKAPRITDTEQAIGEIAIRPMPPDQAAGSK